MITDLDLKHFRNGWKLPIVLGTALGVFPRSSLLTDDETRKHRPSFGLFVYSLILTICLSTDSILHVRNLYLSFNLPGQTLIKKLVGVNVLTYSLCVTFLFCYQLIYCTRFRSLLASIRQSMLKLGTSNSSSYITFSWVVCTSCLVLGVVEDVLYDVQSYARIESTRAKDAPRPSLISRYCSINLSQWHGIIPPENDLITLVLFLLLKLGAAGCAIVDAVVIILCHSLSLQFMTLHQIFRNELVEVSATASEASPPSSKLVSSIRADLLSQVKVVPKKDQPTTWDSAMEKFWMLADLTSEAERYLSPIIVATHMSVCHILLILFAWISPGVARSLTSNSTGYVYFSSIYYMVRLMVVIYFVSQVYHSSHAILNTLERCPSATYAPETERLARKLTGNPVGIRMCGTFLITRHSFLSFISFIFTTEIILLQMANANANKPTPLK